MRYADLHCDTLSLTYDNGTSVLEGCSHVTLEKAASFEHYIQVAAIWSDNRFSDDACWERFFRIRDHFEKEIQSTNKIALCRHPDEIREAETKKETVFIYAVEDARLLAGDETRLDVLFEAGVRFLTLVWDGDSCIGGAKSSPMGLTPFGRRVTERAFALGIVPDLSHASRATVEDVLLIAEQLGKPVVCTHSDAYRICQEERNISDSVYQRIAALGGVTGVCLFPPHLNGTETASIADILSHIRHYLTIDPGAVALGCDFDGIELTPREIPDIAALPLLYETIKKEFSADTADAVFYGNAYRFLMNHLL